MDLGLKGRKAILIGANASVGRHTAEILAQEGCNVALCGRTEEKVDAVVARVNALGVNAFGKAVDASDAKALPAFIDEAAAALGGCDIFISFVSTNLGVDSDEGWMAVMNADILPLSRGVRAALPHLQKSDAGSIVTLSSTGAVEEFMGPQPYNALKAAVINYSKSLAQKHAAEGIRVNCMIPGPIYTEDGPWAGIKAAAPEFYDSILGQIPMGRMCSGEEIGKAIAFVASPACRFMTGASLVIDGALTKRVQF
ncbi:NAD(P)-dependent dehydrogenase (short-subunit alcohol dehydrogenase family) [Sphingobium fontiphilum]|uniref:NAD(P)-dependent dehydrogenase (Short-subunit alcohol dehydrogenase family) n=1 Tax=Sphingobium fontiphilum TaxID=944425 RepID=A0A7W6DD86_9SPHN|nr:SDR family oxidoreductase [Sphingobium fontiphilum]MBB3981038.1 NAD(P)-dependent dehydrogenase (short-subunit alcohol dehydrogenase family) [Sphingobium fontiphilum]